MTRRNFTSSRFFFFKAQGLVAAAFVVLLSTKIVGVLRYGQENE
jgi:hypothetical protein